MQMAGGKANIQVIKNINIQGATIWAEVVLAVAAAAEVVETQIM